MTMMMTSEARHWPGDEPVLNLDLSAEDAPKLTAQEVRTLLGLPRADRFIDTDLSAVSGRENW